MIRAHIVYLESVPTAEILTPKWPKIVAWLTRFTLMPYESVPPPPPPPPRHDTAFTAPPIPLPAPAPAGFYPGNGNQRGESWKHGVTWRCELANTLKTRRRIASIDGVEQG